MPLLFFFVVIGHSFNPLPNDKIVDLSKLKAFADDNLNVNQKRKLPLGRVENNVGKEENAGYQHFFLFPQCFQEASYTGLLTLSQTTNVRLFQTKRVCRRQFQM